MFTVAPGIIDAHPTAVIQGVKLPALKHQFAKTSAGSTGIDSKKSFLRICVTAAAVNSMQPGGELLVFRGTREQRLHLSHDVAGFFDLIFSVPPTTGGDLSQRVSFGLQITIN